MAKMTPTIVDSGRRVFTNMKYLYFIPWVKGQDGGYTLGSEAYDLVNIVGDTVSVEQAENEVNEIPHEFSSEPLYENVTLGAKTFTCECLDFQDTVLGELFGWDSTTVSGITAAPIAYKDLYCAVELGFNSTDDVVVLPKVKLNSRAVLASMKTDASRGTITGTCYSAYVSTTAGGASVETDMFATAGVDGTTADYELSETKPNS